MRHVIFFFIWWYWLVFFGNLQDNYRPLSWWCFFVDNLVSILRCLLLIIKKHVCTFLKLNCKLNNKLCMSYYNFTKTQYLSQIINRRCFSVIRTCLALTEPIRILYKQNDGTILKLCSKSKGTNRCRLYTKSTMRWRAWIVKLKNLTVSHTIRVTKLILNGFGTDCIRIRTHNNVSC